MSLTAKHYAGATFDTHLEAFEAAYALAKLTRTRHWVLAEYSEGVIIWRIDNEKPHVDWPTYKRERK